MPDHPPIAWLFSMIRSGSSIAAYAAAAPFGGVVADEIFGPWVRTGPYYKFPPEQRTVTELFRTSAGVITPEIARAANVVFEKLARGEAGIPVCAPGREDLLEGVPQGGRPIVVKMPHDHPAPAEVARVWPDQRHVFVLRNPVDRLSSIIGRGMLAEGSSGGPGTCITADWDLAQLRQFCARWLRARETGCALVYDDLRRNPEAFFGGMYRAWGWDFDHRTIEDAKAYARSNYHAMSIQREQGADTERPLSTRKRMAPIAAIELYLSDSTILTAMREAGWPTEPGAYLEA
jgi:hypothetical protein